MNPSTSETIIFLITLERIVYLLCKSKIYQKTNAITNNINDNVNVRKNDLTIL